MVGQNNPNSYDELSFGKIGKKYKTSKKSPQKYIIFRLKSSPPRDEDDLLNIDYDALRNYLRGACFGKRGRGISLYNGISNVVRDGFPIETILPLEPSELEKLIQDANIPLRLKIKTIK
jgi:hypothetical protein